LIRTERRKNGRAGKSDHHGTTDTTTDEGEALANRLSSSIVVSLVSWWSTFFVPSNERFHPADLPASWRMPLAALATSH
jgi:hypothetical protein